MFYITFNLIYFADFGYRALLSVVVRDFRAIYLRVSFLSNLPFPRFSCLPPCPLLFRLFSALLQHRIRKKKNCSFLGFLQSTFRGKLRTNLFLLFRHVFESSLETAGSSWPCTNQEQRCIIRKEGWASNQRNPNHAFFFEWRGLRETGQVVTPHPVTWSPSNPVTWSHLISVYPCDRSTSRLACRQTSRPTKTATTKTTTTNNVQDWRKLLQGMLTK